MTKSKSARIKNLILFTLVLMAIVVITSGIFHPGFLHANGHLLILLFFALNLGSIFLMDKGIHVSGKSFINLYLTSMISRLLISFLCILLFLYFGVQNKLIFILNFLFYYLIYLIFEIYTLLTNLRSHFRKG